jgi:hypothetical protein
LPVAVVTVQKYGGALSDEGDAYYCAKGCADMSGGKVKSLDKWCKVAPDAREAACKKYCPGCSSKAPSVADCMSGCSFWAVL